MKQTRHIRDRLQPHGLTMLGQSSDGARRIVLAGNAGPGFWPVFQQSDEFRDGLPDPLDRWSRRIGDQVAAQSGAVVHYPFEGPPFPPFISWALQTGTVSASAISILIHHEFGLWHAYRFALVVEEQATDIKAPAKAESPCDSCVSKPCLDNCPVDAFVTGRFNVDACTAYLASDADSACRKLGCAARRACPVGKHFHYQPDQASFHMDAFLTSRAAGQGDQG